MTGASAPDTHSPVDWLAGELTSGRPVLAVFCIQTDIRKQQQPVM